MAKKTTKRESIIIAAGFILTVITIIISVILISVLSQNLNRFLFAGDDLSEEGPIKFNFEAYNALRL